MLLGILLQKIQPATHGLLSCTPQPDSVNYNPRAISSLYVIYFCDFVAIYNQLLCLHYFLWVAACRYIAHYKILLSWTCIFSCCILGFVYILFPIQKLCISGVHWHSALCWVSHAIHHLHIKWKVMVLKQNLTWSTIPNLNYIFLRILLAQAIKCLHRFEVYCTSHSYSNSTEACGTHNNWQRQCRRTNAITSVQQQFHILTWVGNGTNASIPS